MKLRMTALLFSMILLLSWGFSAQAVGLSKEEKYEASLQELKAYLDGDTDISLDVLAKNFSDLGRFRMSIALDYYTRVLRDVEKNKFSDIDLYLRMLKMDTDLPEFLEENELGSLEELENYAVARKCEYSRDYVKAMEYYERCIGFMDSMIRYGTLYLLQEKIISANNSYTAAPKMDLTVEEMAISAGHYHTVGLKKDGTVVATVVTYKRNDYGQCDVSGWRDIVAISAGTYRTVGLKKDGTVVAVGINYSGQCNVSGWRDIMAISAGPNHTIGLKKDGTVVAVGSNSSGQCNVSGWKDIVAVSAGDYHTVGLKKDGTVVATVVTDKYYDDGQSNVTGWRDIIAVSAGADRTVGLKKDGTVVAVGDNKYGQCDVSGWNDIIAVSTGHWHTVGLKSDGTVVAVGRNNYGQCDVSGWNLLK